MLISPGFGHGCQRCCLRAAHALGHSDGSCQSQAGGSIGRRYSEVAGSDAMRGNEVVLVEVLLKLC